MNNETTSCRARSCHMRRWHASSRRKHAKEMAGWWPEQSIAARRVSTSEDRHPALLVDKWVMSAVLLSWWGCLHFFSVIRRRSFYGEIKGAREVTFVTSPKLFRYLYALQRNKMFLVPENNKRGKTNTNPGWLTSSHRPSHCDMTRTWLGSPQGERYRFKGATPTYTTPHLTTEDWKRLLLNSTSHKKNNENYPYVRRVLQ